MKRSILILVTGIVIGISFCIGYKSYKNNISFNELPEEFYSVLYQNDQIRIIEHFLKPGEVEPMHEHPPMYVYFIEGADVEILGPDGIRIQNTTKAGLKLNLKNKTTHSLKNIGSTSLHTLLVEFKTD